jgi:uncharacterized protein
MPRQAVNFKQMDACNCSANPSIHTLSSPQRRHVLHGGLSALLAGVLAPWAAGCAATRAPAAAAAALRSAPALGFKAVPVSTADTLMVPPGYTARVLFRWGDPVGLPGNLPAFKLDASNTAAEQAAQAGMHHDGMHFYPLTPDTQDRGLLVMNHEYTDDGLLHPGGMVLWTAEKVAKSQHAHGVSVIEVEQVGGQWRQVLPSRYARRITARTRMLVTGPAMGHPLLQTALDPTGTRVLGTFNNCASGMTPWGTYLTCEENFNYYFKGVDNPDAHQRRWGLRKEGFLDWAQFDERFDAAKHPNEFNRHGWIVEIDPHEPESVPVKRTALGRAAHEGATIALAKDGRAVVYMGEDARFEYIYKFVSAETMQPGGAATNRTLLDRGTLYVAKFAADGTGQWLALTHGQNGLTAAAGFADQGEVVIKSRQASDLLGATKMDRPEWIAVDPANGEVYCTLTNNSNRGSAQQPGVDAANPRANNTMGGIIRWKEAGDFSATRFTWDHFVLAGDPANPRAEAKGNIQGDLFACPDGLHFDARGVLWVQTDAHAGQMYKGEFERLGNNQLLAANARTGEHRRFLTGPVNCEITGVVTTPDCKTLFVNVQHPGEAPGDRADPNAPQKFSTWPDGAQGGRPRSSTLVITKDDGGVIGS